MPSTAVLNASKSKRRSSASGPKFFSRDEIGRVLDQPDASDHPFVGIGKTAIAGEIEPHPRKRRFVVAVPDELERTSHAEMEGQPAAMIDIRHEVLAVAASGNELGVLQAGGKCPGREFAQDARIAHHDPGDRLAQRVLCEHTFEAFDIGQFRHLGILQFCGPKTGALFLLRPAGSAASTNSSLCCCKLTASSNEAGFDPGEHQAFPAVTVEIDRETFRQFFDRRQRSGVRLVQNGRSSRRKMFKVTGPTP